MPAGDLKSVQDILNRVLDESNNTLQVKMGTVTDAVRFKDDVLLSFGTTDSTDADLYYDGVDFNLDVNSGNLVLSPSGELILGSATGVAQMQTNGLMMGLAASAPAPDSNRVHIWNGTAGTVDGYSGSQLIIENNAASFLHFLQPFDATGSGLLMGEGGESLSAGFLYNPSGDGTPDTWRILGGAFTDWLKYSAGAFAFQADTLVSGVKGVGFAATQSASADANTLDDYEEGTWTPEFGGTGGSSGQVYSTQDGTYTKIGNVVYIAGQITLSTLGTITTQARIEGFPFTSNATYDAMFQIYHGGMGTGFAQIQARMDQGGTVASLVHFDTGSINPGNMVQAEMTNGTAFRFTGWYQV